MVAWYKTHRNFNVKKHRKSENKKHRRASETNMGTIGRRLPHCRCFPGWDGGDVGDDGDDDGGDVGDDGNGDEDIDEWKVEIKWTLFRNQLFHTSCT